MVLTFGTDRGERLPIAALHGHVEGKRCRGRQKKIWMGNVREDLKVKNVDLTRIGEATRIREVGRSLVIRASPSARCWKKEKKKQKLNWFCLKDCASCI